MSCRVRACRHASTHTIIAHQCGRCGGRGHGQLECRNASARRALESFFFEEMVDDEQCTISFCPDPKTHARSAHVCDHCGTRGSECACAQKTCPMCNAMSHVDLANELYTGSDCVVCMQPGPVVVFTTCKHATVCKSCVRRL